MKKTNQNISEIIVYETNFSTISIRDHLKKLIKKKKISRSHFIMGRWENIYVPLSIIPQVKPILQFANQSVNKISPRSVIIPYRELGFYRDEFWFNIAKPGDSTGWHNHKKGALFSGVYYIYVPDLGGNIKFRHKKDGIDKEWFLEPKTGEMLIFPSKLKHAVAENKSQNDRVSLAFNLFTLPLELDSKKDDYSTGKYY